MRASVIAEYFVLQPSCIHREELAELRWKNIVVHLSAGWAMPANWRLLFCSIFAPIYAKWSVLWMKQISSRRKIIIWIGSKVAHSLRIHPGMTIQRLAPTVQEVMRQQKRVAYGWKLQ